MKLPQCGRGLVDRMLSSAMCYSRRCLNCAVEDSAPPVGFPVESIVSDQIRNFSIIAHVDHGKSTLAERLLELTGCRVPQKKFDSEVISKHPSLDQLPVERERGITVKAVCATMHTQHKGLKYELNLIDTPGHADFSNEVVRSLDAIQGALLLIDAFRGVEAQTVAHYWRTVDAGVKSIVPVINKIDLLLTKEVYSDDGHLDISASIGRGNMEIIDKIIGQVEDQLGFGADILSSDHELLMVSARTGFNVQSILSAVIERIPPPPVVPGNFNAVVIDCWYEAFRGLIVLVAIKGGSVKEQDLVMCLRQNVPLKIMELGIMQPPVSIRKTHLQCGQIGWLRFAGDFEDTKIVQSGDTLISTHDFGSKYGDKFSEHALSNSNTQVRLMEPIVYADVYPAQPDDYANVQKAITRLLLNDANAQIKEQKEQISSATLGAGWRIGFLGPLHSEVFRQRLEQEHGVLVIMTPPNVTYKMVNYSNEGKVISESLVRTVKDLPSKSNNLRHRFLEPMIMVDVNCPIEMLGVVTESLKGVSRSVGKVHTTPTFNLSIKHLSTKRVKICACLPQSECVDGTLSDRVLSLTGGLAVISFKSIDDQWQPVSLVALRIFVHGEPVELLDSLQPAENAPLAGRNLAKRLRELLPAQSFDIPIQAKVGGRVVARETVRAIRNDVTAKCYGGDETRKMKLRENQKTGRAKLRQFGRVTVPHHVFFEIMRKGTSLN